MNKYVIRNCENLLYCTSCKEYECAIADDFGYKRRCSDNNNCKLKQIVELCKEYKKDYNTTNGVWLLANNITNLLDIQEVE